MFSISFRRRLTAVALVAAAALAFTPSARADSSHASKAAVHAVHVSGPVTLRSSWS